MTPEQPSTSARKSSTWGIAAISSGSPTSSTCSSPGSRPRSSATFRAYRAVVVTSTRASPRRSRCSIGSGPNAENNRQHTAPCLSVPSAATYSSGIRPARTKTRSPRLTPSASSTPAKRSVSRLSAAYVSSVARMALAQETQRNRVRERTIGVPIHRLERDVQTSARQPRQPRPSRRPRELRPRPIIIGHIRSGPSRRPLEDRAWRPCRKVCRHHDSIDWLIRP